MPRKPDYVVEYRKPMGPLVIFFRFLILCGFLVIMYVLVVQLMK